MYKTVEQNSVSRPVQSATTFQKKGDKVPWVSKKSLLTLLPTLQRHNSVNTVKTPCRNCAISPGTLPAAPIERRSWNTEGDRRKPHGLIQRHWWHSGTVAVRSGQPQKTKKDCRHSDARHSSTGKAGGGGGGCRGQSRCRSGTHPQFQTAVYHNACSPHNHTPHTVMHRPALPGSTTPSPAHLLFTCSTAEM